MPGHLPFDEALYLREMDSLIETAKDRLLALRPEQAIYTVAIWTEPNTASSAVGFETLVNSQRFVAHVVGNPTSFQSSPLDFFARTFSCINSAITSFFWMILAFRCPILRSLAPSPLRWPEDRSKVLSATSSTCLTHRESGSAGL